MTPLRKGIRVVRRALRTVDARRFRRFGAKLEFRRIVSESAKYLERPSMQRRADEYQREIDKWLSREYAGVIEKWRDPSAIPAPAPKLALDARPRIWTLWFQGRESAPEIVKQCIDSMERNRGCAELVVLDSQSIGRYLDVDPEILRKVERGTVTLAAFSDYLRLSLLYRYGGLWLDSTIWVNHPIAPPILKCRSTPSGTSSSSARPFRGDIGPLSCSAAA